MLGRSLILSELAIDKNSPEPFHLQLYKMLKNSIVKQRLEAGVALPSERQLSNKFGLNRNTVHRAYENLLAKGFVVRRPGSRGLFIAKDAKTLYQPSFPCLGIMLRKSFSDFLSKSNTQGVNYLSGVVDRANELGYSTMIITLPGLAASKNEIIEWRDNLILRLSGILYFGNRGIENDFAFETLATYKNLPQVFVSAQSSYANVSSVIADVSAGGMAAAELLRENGHRKVGIILPTIVYNENFIYAAFERAKIMRKCFEACGLRVKPEWIAGDCNNLATMTQKLDRILTSNDAPTAFWCQNDLTALCALEYFKLRKISIPEDISLIGYDDIDDAAQADPPLTSIRAGTYTTGRKATELAIELFKNGRPGERRTIKVPTSLSCRQSIGRAKKELIEMQTY